MKNGSKIIHVHFLESETTMESHYYFGSLSALYDTFNKDDVGICQSVLYKQLQKSNVYCTQKCIIRKSELIRKNQSALRFRK